MQQRKATRLQNLQDGSPFIIEPLKEVFKVMYLIRGGDSTCKVQGYKQTEAGGYSSTFLLPQLKLYMTKKERACQSLSRAAYLSLKSI